MKLEKKIEQRMKVAIEICERNGKNVEQMTEFIQGYSGADHETVMRYLQEQSVREIRKYENRKNTHVDDAKKSIRINGFIGSKIKLATYCDVEHCYEKPVVEITVMTDGKVTSERLVCSDHRRKLRKRMNREIRNGMNKKYAERKYIG